MVTVDDALGYLRRGWCIIPMHASEKRPACNWKRFQTRRPEEAKLETWFGENRGYGLGVVYGAVSGGLASRDFDTLESYRRWAGEHPSEGRILPTVETVRGRHVYCRAEPGSVERIRTKLDKPQGTGAIVCDDGELRAGVGCYSLLPPSRHPSGFVYRWLIPLAGELPALDLEAVGFVACNREYGENGGNQREPKTLLDVSEGSESNESADDLATEPLRQCPQLSPLAPYSLSSLLQQQVEEAIGRTVPSRIGQRHGFVFEFARELKALAGFADAPLAQLKPIVRQWHRTALPNIQTKPFDDTWFEFTESWGKVKYPKGQEPISMMFQKAIAAELPDVALQYEQSELRLLVALCRELQRACGDGPFFLSARTAGGLLAVNHVRAARWLRGLCKDEVLKLVVQGSRDEHRASRYRYLPDQTEIPKQPT